MLRATLLLHDCNCATSVQQAVQSACRSSLTPSSLNRQRHRCIHLARGLFLVPLPLLYRLYQAVKLAWKCFTGKRWSQEEPYASIWSWAYRWDDQFKEVTGRRRKDEEIKDYFYICVCVCAIFIGARIEWKICILFETLIKNQIWSASKARKYVCVSVVRGKKQQQGMKRASRWSFLSVTHTSSCVFSSDL